MTSVVKPLGVCVRVLKLHVASDAMCTCDQEDFWIFTKPLLEKGSSLKHYNKVARQAARDFLQKVGEEPHGE